SASDPADLAARLPRPVAALGVRRRRAAGTGRRRLACRAPVIRAPRRRLHRDPRRPVLFVAVAEEPLMLEVRGVSFAYDGTEAVRACTASFAATRLVAITGPNGSGKSTLLKLIARVL